jgi:hypothetical protein
MRSRLLLVALSLVLTGLAHAADLAGKWTAEFDSPIGVQKYVYEFKTEGGKLTGKAAHDHSMGKGETALKDIKLTGDEVSFTEPLKINDMEITVTYKGKITANEMKLTRVVGDFGSEELVAKRAAPAAK